jgi:hypothetical protein
MKQSQRFNPTPVTKSEKVPDRHAQPNNLYLFCQVFSCFFVHYFPLYSCIIFFMSFSLITNRPEIQDIFQNIVSNLPSDCEVYLVGGAIRNALYRHYFEEQLPQRDYDQIATQNSSQYLEFLKSLSFMEGGTVRTEEQIVYHKSLVPDPAPTGFNDWVVFDIHLVDGTTAIDSLSRHVGLTINGFALSVRDVFAPDWIDKIVSLPGAGEDLRAKQLHVNPIGYKTEPANLFAVLRFMSIGFTPPPKDEIKLLLEVLPSLSKDRFSKNIPKLYNYVGGEFAARKLVDSLGIAGDLFNEEAVRSGKVTV